MLSELANDYLSLSEEQQCKPNALAMFAMTIRKHIEYNDTQCFADDNGVCVASVQRWAAGKTHPALHARRGIVNKIFHSELKQEVKEHARS